MTQLNDELKKLVDEYGRLKSNRIKFKNYYNMEKLVQPTTEVAESEYTINREIRSFAKLQRSISNNEYC